MLPSIPDSADSATDMPSTDDLARQLLQAYTTGQRLDVLPDSGPLNIEQAYAVQRAVWRKMTAGARPAAWKVGAPNRTSEATAAAIFPQRVARSPATFSARDFHTLGIEAEIAVCFGRDLPARADPRAEPFRREQILAAIDSVHVAMELVDSRLADTQAAGPLWRLADSLLNGGLVIGEAIPDWRELDFSKLTVRAYSGEKLLTETVGRPPLDDLFFCLPWWLTFNGGAQAGDIITTGAWNGMHPVGLPAEVSAEFVGVGSVSAVLA